MNKMVTIIRPYARKILVFPLLILIALLYSAALLPNVELEHVYGVLPALVIYDDKLLEAAANDEKNFDGLLGISQGIFVMAKRDLQYSDDGSCMLKHELTHIKQYYRTLFILPFLCKYSDRYRLKYEAEAYATCINNFDDLKEKAYILKALYVPNIDVREIVRQLVLAKEAASQ